jgi:hypothetical protein
LPGRKIEPWLGEARSAVQDTFGVLERELPEEETPTKWVVDRRKRTGVAEAMLGAAW